MIKMFWLFSWSIPLFSIFLFKPQNKIKIILFFCSFILMLYGVTKFSIYCYDVFTIKEPNKIYKFSKNHFKGTLCNVELLEKQNASLVLKSLSTELKDTNFYEFIIKNGKTQIPSGIYQFYAFEINFKDKNKFYWRIWSHKRFNTKKLTNIIISKNKNNTVYLGLPIYTMAYIQEDDENKKITIECQIKDIYGNVYKISKKKGWTEYPISFMLKSEDGNISYKDNFDCFCNNSHSKELNNIKLPEGYYEVSVLFPDNIPFKCVQSENKCFIKALS